MTCRVHPLRSGAGLEQSWLFFVDKKPDEREKASKADEKWAEAKKRLVPSAESPGWVEAKYLVSAV